MKPGKRVKRDRAWLGRNWQLRYDPQYAHLFPKRELDLAQREKVEAAAERLDAHLSSRYR